MVFEISKYALMDRVREKKEIEDAIAAANSDSGNDLGSANSVEHLILSGGTVSLAPDIHTSWLDTSSSGPTTITLIGPLTFGVGLRKLINVQILEDPADIITLGPSAIRTAGGATISSIVFSLGGQWLLLEAWDTDVWRVVRSSGVVIS